MNESETTSSSSLSSSSPLQGGNEKNDTVKEVKLPYFHRTLSEEDRLLVGDETPKKIEESDPCNSISISNSNSSGATAQPMTQGGSAWNASMSWEEKNCTKWASDYIQNQLFATSSNFGPILLEEGIKQLRDIEIVSIVDVTGNANITHSRGKKRFLYEFALDLSILVHAASREEPYKARVKVEDCINDQLSDIVISVTWPNGQPASDVTVGTRKFINGNKFKGFMISKFKTFEAEYQSK